MVRAVRGHGHRCKKCKDRFAFVLESIGKEPVHRNVNFNWPAFLTHQANLGGDASAFLDCVYGRLLKAAWGELGSALTALVRAPLMAPVDYFLPRSRAVVEFDSGDGCPDQTRAPCSGPID
jgi:hypothetical protein